jgi:hypothetical protein
MSTSTKIYLVENIKPGTNKVYIGKTKNDDRFYGHQTKYGLQIQYSIIDEINSLNHNDWEPLETYWIEQFRQWGFEVVNKRKKGGSGPISHTEETKQKIRKGKIGHECYNNIERNNKISKALQNHSKHYTEDIIQKMKKPKPEGFGELLSQIKKGKPRPDLKGRVSPNKGKVSPNKGNNKPKPQGFGEHKYKPIYQYDLNNNIFKEWSSIKEAKLFTNIKNIPLALSGANKTAGGYIWKYKNL